MAERKSISIWTFAIVTILVSSLSSLSFSQAQIIDCCSELKIDTAIKTGEITGRLIGSVMGLLYLCTWKPLFFFLARAIPIMLGVVIKILDLSISCFASIAELCLPDSLIMLWDFLVVCSYTSIEYIVWILSPIPIVNILSNALIERMVVPILIRLVVR